MLASKTSVVASTKRIVSDARIGVLLVNLGTPDALGYWPVRRYLKEFLSDRRVVNTPRLIWWPLLNLVILSRRPQRSSKNYATIWNKERDESPLKTITRSQAESLRPGSPRAAWGKTDAPSWSNGRCATPRPRSSAASRN